jgi:hypothetical protein
MYRQPSKQKIIIQRAIVYALMTVSVIGLVVVLAFVMLGYQFDSSDGKIEQGGLVQFDSRPSGASVSIDDMVFGTRTASKTTMKAGNHDIEMNLKGYESWKKSVTVVPGSVLWLNYARLIPTEKKTTDVATFDAVSGALSSGDDKKMAIKEAATTPSIRLADLTRDDVVVDTLTLPETSYTHPVDPTTQQFMLDSWDSNSRYLLVKHAYDTTQEWLVVDTQNVKETKNVTTLLGIQVSRIVFSNNDGMTLYAQIGSDVRKINLKDTTLSRPLVSNVAQFSLYGDSMVTYVSLPDAAGSRTVGYTIDGMRTSQVVKTVADSTSDLRFVVGRYFSETYEAISVGDTVEILRGDLPRDDNTDLSLTRVTDFTLAGGVQYLSDHTNGRFIVAQNTARFATYDLELSKANATEIKDADATARELGWLDEHTIWSDRGGMLHLYEFDGANQHDLIKVAPGMAASLSPNGKYLYGITAEGDGRYHLTRLQLLL